MIQTSSFGIRNLKLALGERENNCHLTFENIDLVRLLATCSIAKADDQTVFQNSNIDLQFENRQAGRDPSEKES